MSDCILLCGGKGTRLGLDIPKALVSVNDKTILHWRIQHFLKYNIEHMIVAIADKDEQTFTRELDYLKTLYSPLRYSLSIEDSNKRLGTGGAVCQAMREYVEGDFAFVTNVDDISFPDLYQMQRRGTNTLMISNPRVPYGVVQIDSRGILGFKEKPLLEDTWVSCGLYYLEKRLAYPDIGSIEYDVFPKIHLKYFKYKGLWTPINDKKQLEEAERLLLDIN